MKTLKLFFTSSLLLLLMLAKSQNACFGTFTFQAEGSYDPEMRFTPSYLLNTNWHVDNAKWTFGDGTDSTTTTNYLLHDYSATTDTAVNVCLIVWATDTVNSISCSDTICKNVPLCNPAINSSVATSISGYTISVTSSMQLYTGGTYPIAQLVYFGDTSSASYTFQSGGVNTYTHTYAAPGVYILNVLSMGDNNCLKDTSIIVTIEPTAPCNTNASFTNVSYGTQVSFTNTSISANGYTSQWLFYTPTAFNLTTTTHPVVNFMSRPGPYTARLIVRDSINGCRDTLWQPFVLDFSHCTSNAGFTYSTNTNGDVLFTNTSTFNVASPPQYMWHYLAPNLVGSTNIVNPHENFAGATGPITVMLALYDTANFCRDTIQQTLAYTPLPCSISASFTYQFLNDSVVKLINNTTPTGTYYSYWHITSPEGYSRHSNAHSPTITLVGAGPFTVSLLVTDTAANYTCRDTLVLELVNGCAATASYTYTLSSDTAILANTSSTLAAIGLYEVKASYAATGMPYSSLSGSFSDVSKVKLPQDTLMDVCLIAHDTSGTCTDTFCTSIGIWQPCAVVSNFTFTQTGSAVLVYNASTGNYPPLTYQWQAPGAWPSSSTATDTAFYFSLPGVQQICLIATNAIGCKDTFCTTINNIPTDTLCGMVYIDANSNGIYDSGEQVRPNSTVNVDGSLYYTDSSGFYRAPVVSGTHVVSLIAPPGWAQTFPDTPLVYSIVTAMGDYMCGIDFGMRDDTLLLSGIAYLDNNGNGMYDAGDAPRTNVPIVINGTNGSATVYTDNTGYYSYAVYSGTYTISSSTPALHGFTQPYNINSYNVTVYSSSLPGLNFGVRNNSVSIRGKVFIDANSNGVYDMGEQGVSNQQVNVGGSIVYTNSIGDWAKVALSGMQTVTYAPSNNYVGYTQTTAGTINVNAVNAGAIYGDNNFGIYMAPGTGDVCITLSPSSVPWPFSSSIFYSIQLTNYGNIPMPGVLEMNFDPLYTYLASNTAPSSIDQANYTLRWNLTVAVGQTIYIRPRFTMPNTTPAGVPLFSQAFFAPDAGFIDVNMACNEDTLHQVTVAAYDPNDKYVSPIGQGNNHAINNVGQKLDYTIMFQNTGSAPAVNVILLDTVEADLDIESFVMKDASHDYRVEINGQEIQWTFNNIMLPDSNTSADSSIGFVSFSMKAKQNLAEGTLVTNRAGIYFDYNDVVATGTAFNTIETATSIADIAQGANISIQPNPFNAYTNLVITGGNSQAQYTLRVYDVLGKLVQQVHANTNIIRIERNNMQQGMYMYEVEQDNKLIGKGKLIAE